MGLPDVRAMRLAKTKSACPIIGQALLIEILIRKF
jgi:hypothetical protein